LGCAFPFGGCELQNIFIWGMVIISWKWINKLIRFRLGIRGGISVYREYKGNGWKIRWLK
jgi:hypothetical protein